MNSIRTLPMLRTSIASSTTTPFPHRSFAVEPIKLSYSVKEAAAAIGTSEKTIRNFIDRGQIPTFSLPGLERVLIKASDLAAFVNDQPSSRRIRTA